MYSLPETNIAPENRWLEDDPFLLGWSIFRGYVTFREGIYTYITCTILQTLLQGPTFRSQETHGNLPTVNLVASLCQTSQPQQRLFAVTNVHQSGKRWYMLIEMILSFGMWWSDWCFGSNKYSNILYKFNRIITVQHSSVLTEAGSLLVWHQYSMISLSGCHLQNKRWAWFP